MNSYRDLRVWQLGMDVVVQVYQLTQEFPRHETYGLAGQMQRAAVSIPSNIAEGHTREHIKEYLHHLSMAQASLSEVETQIEIAVRLAYLSATQAEILQEQLNVLGRQLYSLRNVLRRRLSPPTPETRHPTPET